MVKQALPFVRCVGEAWPLPLSRATYECKALREERKVASRYVPEVYHFEEKHALIGLFVSGFPRVKLLFCCIAR